MTDDAIMKKLEQINDETQKFRAIYTEGSPIYGDSYDGDVDPDEIMLLMVENPKLLAVVKKIAKLEKEIKELQEISPVSKERLTEMLKVL